MTGRRFSQRINTSANAWRMNRHSKAEWQLLSHGWLFATPWTIAHQPPLSMQFSRQEFWSGLPFPSPQHREDCPNKVKRYSVFKLSKKLAESKEPTTSTEQLARLVPWKFVFYVIFRTKIHKQMQTNKNAHPKDQNHQEEWLVWTIRPVWTTGKNNWNPVLHKAKTIGTDD